MKTAAIAAACALVALVTMGGAGVTSADAATSRSVSRAKATASKTIRSPSTRKGTNTKSKLPPSPCKGGVCVARPGKPPLPPVTR